MACAVAPTDAGKICIGKLTVLSATSGLKWHTTGNRADKAIALLKYFLAAGKEGKDGIKTNLCSPACLAGMPAWDKKSCHKEDKCVGYVVPYFATVTGLQHQDVRGRHYQDHRDGVAAR